MSAGMGMVRLITKLDQNAITPKEAKDLIARLYGVAIKGRTREDVIRAIARSR